MSGWRRIRPSTGTKGPKPEKQMRNFSLAHARNEEMTTFSDRCSYTWCYKGGLLIPCLHLKSYLAWTVFKVFTEKELRMFFTSSDIIPSRKTF